MRAGIEEALTARSPIQKYQDAEKEVLERWEDELRAAVEAEYRRQRADLLGVLQWWLLDVWVQTLSGEDRGQKDALLSFPRLEATRRVAQRVTTAEAMENLQTFEQLQRLLGTNVQEALALEVGLLKLRL